MEARLKDHHNLEKFADFNRNIYPPVAAMAALRSLTFDREVQDVEAALGWAETTNGFTTYWILAVDRGDVVVVKSTALGDDWSLRSPESTQHETSAVRYPATAILRVSADAISQLRTFRDATAWVCTYTVVIDGQEFRLPAPYAPENRALEEHLATFMRAMADARSAR